MRSNPPNYVLFLRRFRIDFDFGYSLPMQYNLRIMSAILVFGMGCSNSEQNQSDPSSDPDSGTESDDSTGSSDTENAQDAKTSEDARDSDRSKDDQGETRLFFAEEFNSDRDYLLDPDPNWSILHPDQADQIIAVNGRLEVVPTAVNQNHWFEQFQSPYLYTDLNGDFVLEIAVEVTALNDSNSAPTAGFNAAGFVIRDPASAVGSENWIMYNLGAQSDSVPYGVEAKTTVDSTSVLELFNVSPQPLEYRLRVCRIGTLYRYFFAPTDLDTWQETMPNASHNRPDLPDLIQVGILAGTWTAVDMTARFDWFRAWRAEDENSCTEPFPLD